MKKFLFFVLLSLLTVLFVFGNVRNSFAEKPEEDERTHVKIHHIPGNPELEKMVFIFRKAKTKGAPAPATDANTSYKLISNGLHWETLPVSFGINSPAYFSEIVKAFEQWDNFTSKNLFSSPTAITGGSLERDNTNTIFWQPLSALFGSEVIAITQIIYNTRTRIILESDMAFNSDLPWGIANPDAFDIQNIATHELGHVLSLDDLYKTITSELTMYGYAIEGETKKQTLGEGDKLGLWKVYGN